MKKDTVSHRVRSDASQQIKPERKPPKISPLPGYIEERYVKCGRSNCHCNTGKGHGPYHYRVYRRRNRKFKEYIKKEDVSYFSACINERRRQAEETAKANRDTRLYWQSVRERLREIDKHMKEISGFMGI